MDDLECKKTLKLFNLKKQLGCTFKSRDEKEIDGLVFLEVRDNRKKMILIKSFNVRGLGCRIKKNKVTEFISSISLEFCCYKRKYI